MGALPRHRVILELLEAQGAVKVADLCERLGVSEMTIRRDLAELEREGVLRRTHGGAISARGRSYEPPFLTRATSNQEQKARIGRLAASLVEEGDSVALDIGTTTLEIARALHEKRNLTVLTNSLHIANILASHPTIRLIVIGGILRPVELSMVGGLAEQSYREFFVDKLFLGVGGLSVEAGLTEYSLEDALVKRAMIKNAKERFVVADASKLNRVAFVHVAALSDVHALITDASADDAIVHRIQESGIRIWRA